MQDQDLKQIKRETTQQIISISHPNSKQFLHEFCLALARKMDERKIHDHRILCFECGWEIERSNSDYYEILEKYDQISDFALRDDDVSIPNMCLSCQEPYHIEDTMQLLAMWITKLRVRKIIEAYLILPHPHRKIKRHLLQRNLDNATEKVTKSHKNSFKIPIKQCEM